MTNMYRALRMALISTLAVSSLLGCGATNPQLDDPGLTIVELANRSVLEVLGDLDDGKRTMGSAVVIDGPSGLLLTNSHVVEGATKLAVRDADGRRYEARIVAKDECLDLALLRVEVLDLPTMKLAQEKPRLGEQVYVIGNALGLGQATSTGIVSALDRGPFNFIQTDAALNKGNSGGALVNSRGELIGISSRIYSNTGSSIGIGWAIPNSTIARALPEFSAHGRVRHGRTGIIVERKPSTILGPSGLLIGSLEDGSPALIAGMKPGDIVVRVNGYLVDETAPIEAVEVMLPIGTPVIVEAIRGATSFKFLITISNEIGH